MADNDIQGPAPAEVQEIDRLYRSFPDLSGWGRLGRVRRELWARFSAELANQRAGVTPEVLAKAVQVAVRAAAIDTGAIEGLYQVDRGFTMSVAWQSLAWEHSLAERGPGVRELFEAQLAGYELAIDVVTGKVPLSEAWLRTLHECICAAQPTYRVLTAMGWQEHTLPKGSYKKLPSHVRLGAGRYHAYAPVDAVVPEMHRLIEQLRTIALEEAHPIEQAAYAHYALTVIHPFADGNGRVARALASVYLYRSLSIPLVIFANQRPAYLSVLETADHGDHGPWLDFVADRGIETMQLVGENLRSAAAPQPGEIAERLRSDSEHDNLALYLLNDAQERWERAVEVVRAHLNLARVDRGLIAMDLPPGYRRTGGREAPIVAIQLVGNPPAAFSASRSFRVNIATDNTSPFVFQLETLGSQDRLDIRDTDVAPEISPSLKARLDGWVQRQLGAMLAEIEQQAREMLQR